MFTINNKRRIVRTEHIDDGSTAGKEVLIDNYGGRWRKCRCSKETLPTDANVMSIDKDGVLWQSLR